VMLRKSALLKFMGSRSSGAVPPISHRGLVRLKLSRGFASFVPMLNFVSQSYNILKYKNYFIWRRADRNLLNGAYG
jgi:hypothetical protein